MWPLSIKEKVKLTVSGYYQWALVVQKYLLER